jgi:hypothetical protein
MAVGSMVSEPSQALGVLWVISLGVSALAVLALKFQSLHRL